MKINSKYFLTGTLVAIAVGATVWFYIENNQLKNNLNNLSNQINLLRLKSEADDWFIQGRTDEALARYRLYDSLANDTLIRQRTTLSFYQSSSSEADQLTELTAKLQQQQQLLREYEQQQKNSPTSVTSDESDEVQLLQNEITALRQKLEGLQRQVENTAPTKGILRFASSKNGSVTYFGDLARGKANGEGIGYWKSGSTYEGTWKDNQRHGKGVFIWADGEKYEGEYQNDQRHGYGIYIAKAGRYEGQWLNDMRHGEGYLYEASGKLKVHGIWQNDKLVKTLK